MLLAGCAKEDGSTDSNAVSSSEDETEEETLEPIIPTMVSMEDIREAAENFSGSYKNLDFTDTVFSIPENDSVYELTFTMPTEAEEFETMEDMILANMDELAGSSDVGNLRWMLWDDDRTVTLASELSTEEKAGQACLTYNDGTYTALLYCNTYMLEMADSKLWADLAGYEEFDENYKFTYRPMFIEDQTLVATYNLPEDSIDGISYTLMDGEMSVEDAVSYVEEEIKNYYYVGKSCIDFYVSEVDVYQLSSGEYYYYFYLSGSYDGIKMSDFVGFTFEEDQDIDFAVSYTYHEAAMIYTDRISYIWGQHGYSDVETEEETEFVSLDDACNLVSRLVSSNASLSISEVSLVYDTHDFKGGDSRGDDFVSYIEGRLVYEFIVSNPQILGYSAVRFCVDAVTGETYTMYSE